MSSTCYDTSEFMGLDLVSSSPCNIGAQNRSDLKMRVGEIPLEFVVMRAFSELILPQGWHAHRILFLKFPTKACSPIMACAMPLKCLAVSLQVRADNITSKIPTRR